MKVSKDTLPIVAAPLPRCTGCGQKTPRHAIAANGNRYPLCGECARKS